MENNQIKNGAQSPTMNEEQAVVRKYAGKLNKIVYDPNLSEDQKRSKLIKLMGRVEREIKFADADIYLKQMEQKIDHYRDARISLGASFGVTALMWLYGAIFGDSVSPETINHVCAIMGGGAVLCSINALVSGVKGASQEVRNNLAEQSIKDNTVKKENLKALQKQICKQMSTDDSYSEM